VLHPELAPRDQGRPPDLDPAMVEVVVAEDARPLRDYRLVRREIEQLDELTLRVDDPGDTDGRAEEASDALGDGRLAVAGKAVEKEAATGVDRGAQDLEHVLGDEQVAKRAAEVFLLGVFAGDRLGGNRLDVVVKRDRSRSHVRALAQIKLRPRPAG